MIPYYTAVVNIVTVQLDYFNANSNKCYFCGLYSLVLRWWFCHNFITRSDILRHVCLMSTDLCIACRWIYDFFFAVRHYNSLVSWVCSFSISFIGLYVCTSLSAYFFCYLLLVCISIKVLLQVFEFAKRQQINWKLVKHMYVTK